MSEDIWWKKAACQGLEVMFDLDIENYETMAETAHWERGKVMPASRKGKPKYMYRIEQECIAICNACPVRFECLQDALDNGDEYGMRGGMLPKDRQKLMTKLGIVPWSRREYNRGLPIARAEKVEA